MGPWFIATERFGPSNKETWTTYIQWSGLTQLDELVSLDGSLNRPVLKEMKPAYWPYVPDEHHMFGLFTDLDFLRNEIAGIPEWNLLCVYRNPSGPPLPPTTPVRFELLGYDLVEVDGAISALSNCGGFPDVFSNEELSRHGLLISHGRAQEVQSKLRTLHPEEPHAHCHIWAIARAVDL